MIKYNKVRSTLKPVGIKIDEYNVYVNTNITEINEEDFNGYEYDMEMYTKDEYTQLTNYNVTSDKVALTSLVFALMDENTDLKVRLNALEGGAI